MNSQLNLLRSGIAAIHDQQYAQAVEALEAFCRDNTSLKPNEYFEAQRWLIKAYQRNGQVDLAIYLCQQMTDSPNAQTRSWAKSNLEWLQEESGTKTDLSGIQPPELDNSAAPSTSTQGERSANKDFIPLTSASFDAGADAQDLAQIQANPDPSKLLPADEVAKLLKDGQKALKMGRYGESIEQLERLCGGVESTHKDFAQAQMSLVKAYDGGEQQARAIALCRQLTTSEKEYVQVWATQFLLKLTPASGATATPATAQSIDPTKLLPPEEVAKLLKDGQKALKMGRFSDAIEQLERLCSGVETTHKDFAQAQMSLVKAYDGGEQKERAIELCRQLTASEKEYVQVWATQFLLKLDPNSVAIPAPSAPANHSSSGSNWHEDSDEESTDPDAPTIIERTILPKAGRAEQGWVKFLGQGVTANLTLASGITLSLLFGMVLVLSLVIVPRELRETNPTLWLIIAASITIAFNLLMFFVSPYIMDAIQQLLYSTRWTSLSEIQRLSPESAKIIREVCKQKNLREPRLGIIDDNNPTAFTYGALPNSARLVVSKGLFQYLDDDEAATVYAHELGHIVHWDFAVMTLASTLVQITYLIYVYGRQITKWLGNSSVEKNIKQAANNAALVAYVFYVAGEFMLLYLSRIREYHADRFAAEVTGNPNALSRALVKIAYGITEEERQHPEQSKVMLRGTRALGICDGKAAVASGAAYRAATTPRKVGKVFLWDMFNPWAWWMELMSTHPLTGKRIRALTTYAEQLGLATEYDMAAIVKEGNGLNRSRLYRSFFSDLLLMFAPPIGWFGGLLIGTIFARSGGGWRVAFSCALIGLGLGLLLKMAVMYPDYDRAIPSDVLTLMSDPYANPLRGRPVKLNGEIIGRGNAGNKAGADLAFHDATGKIVLHFNSRFGWLGNVLFGWTTAASLIGQQVSTVGWFRRSIASRVDLVSLECPSIPVSVASYHRFWTVVYGLGSILFGLAIPAIFR
jgi:Zn-dependent protease with chaperone function/outer membrane protein assembly factor BamD (BamD/ComL family)